MTKRSIAIIGGGIMGGDIATSFVAAGWDVHVMSPSAKTRSALPARVARGLARLNADASGAAGVSAYAAMEDVPWQAVDLVIESVSEDLALKQQVFTALETHARPDVPLATNTSSFPIADIGRHLKTRARVCGAHYFMPAHLVPLVEVVRAEFTAHECAERVFEILQGAGKVPVMVKKDIPGFLANRMQHALLREVFWLLDNGVATPEDLDAAVRYGFGFRFIACGPIMQKEMSGWDTNYHAGSTIYPSLSNAAAPPKKLKDLVDRGAIGMKAGEGLWKWTDESIAREKARYEKALQAGFQILQNEKGGDRT